MTAPLPLSTIEQLRSEFLAHFDNSSQLVPPAVEDRFGLLLSSADFDSMTFDRDWLVQQSLVRGQPAVLGGPAKSLKTSVALDLAISLAGGPATPFLGRFPVPESQCVGIFSGESGEATIQDCARRICASKGVNLADMPIRWSFVVPKISDEQQLNRLRDIVSEHELEVVIVDPLYLTVSGDVDPRNMFDMGPLLQSVARSCHDAGATLIIAHHTPKQTRNTAEFAPLGLTDLAFAGCTEFARQWLLLSRRSAYEEGSGRHDLWLSLGGSFGHSACWALNIDEGQILADFSGRQWQVAVQSRAEAVAVKQAEKEHRQLVAQAGKLEQDCALICQALNCGPQTIPDLENATELTRKRILLALDRLRGLGIVSKTQVVKAGGNSQRGYPGWRLLTDAPPHSEPPTQAPQDHSNVA